MSDRLDKIASDLAEVKTSTVVASNELRHLVDRLPKIEQRLTVLEAWRWKAAGALTVALFVGVPVFQAVIR